MYNFVEEYLFSLLILEIYPCITDGLGKLLCELYITTYDFSFLPQLCYDSANHEAISCLLKTVTCCGGLDGKTWQGYPKFWRMSCGRTSSLEFDLSDLWLIALGRYNHFVFKAKCGLCHKQWKSHCPVHGSFFHPILYSFWVNQCIFVWLMALKQTCDQVFVHLGGPGTSWTPWASRATRTQRSSRRYRQRWSSWDAWHTGELVCCCRGVQIPLKCMPTKFQRCFLG